MNPMWVLKPPGGPLWLFSGLPINPSQLFILQSVFRNSRWFSTGFGWRSGQFYENWRFYGNLEFYEHRNYYGNPKFNENRKLYGNPKFYKKKTLYEHLNVYENQPFYENQEIYEHWEFYQHLIRPLPLISVAFYWFRQAGEERGP